VALALFLPFDGLVSLFVISAVFGLFQGGIVSTYAVIVRESSPPAEVGTRVGIALGSTLVHYWTLRYRVHEGRLEIVVGLLDRSVRTIAPDRVQNVERVQNIFQRAFGLVEVRVDTAGGPGVEGLLSALSVEEADRLIEALAAARPVAAVAAADEVLVETSFADLLRVGVTAGRPGVAFVVFGVALLAFDILGWRDELRPPVMVAVGAAALIGVWLLGIVNVFLTNWRFKLARRAAGLYAEQGLFTRRQIDLRGDKVQSVAIVEPLLHRWLGFGSLRIETAAVAATEGRLAMAEAIVPAMDTAHLRTLAHEVLPIAPDLDDLEPADPRAFPSVVASGLLRALGSVVVAVFLFRLWGLFALVLVPLAWVDARLDLGSQGVRITEDAVVVRRGFWRRWTVVLPRRKIQSVQAVEGPLVRLLGLSVVVLRVAGTAVALPAMSREAAAETLDALARVGRRPRST
jgi:putative membrane protein